MALSGSFQNLCMSSNKCGLYCTWSATQSYAGNYSDVTVNTYLRIFDAYLGSRTLTSNIGGNTTNIAIAAIEDGSTKLHDVLLNSRTVRVNHNSDGTANGVTLAVSYDIRANYSGTYYEKIDASTSVNLNSIDRSAPTVNLSLSNITQNSVTATITTNVTSDIWEYSTDNGSRWTTISTRADTILLYTITGLTPNTSYNIKVRARRQSNQIYGISSAKSITTLGGSIINSVNTLTVDDANPVLTMNWTVYANYTHTLVIKDDYKEVLTITGLTCSPGTNNKTIALTDEQRTIILQYMTSLQSFNATYELFTYNGDTQIGNSTSKTAIIQTTYENSAPIFLDFTHRDYNRNNTADITGNNQIYIKGRSSMYIEAGERYPQNGTTFEKYRVTVGSYVRESTKSSFEFGSIDVVGDNVALTVELIDCRGYSTSITKYITVVDYEPVSITDYSIRRKNEVGSIGQLSFSGVFSPIMVDGVAKNKIVSAEYRVIQNGTTVVGWISKTVTQTSDSFEYSTTGLSHPVGYVNFDPELQYIVEVRVTDRLKSDTVAMTLNKGMPLVAFRPKKVGINEPNPQAALHIRGENPLMLNDTLILDLIHPIGSYYWSSLPTDPAEIFGGTWEQVKDRFILAAGDNYTAGKTGGNTTTSIDIQHLPKAITVGIPYANSNGSYNGAIKGESIFANGAIVGYVETTLTISDAEQTPLEIMPPYEVAYCWKRIE